MLLSRDGMLLAELSVVIHGEMSLRDAGNSRGSDDFSDGVLYLCKRLSSMLTMASPEYRAHIVAYHQYTRRTPRAQRSNA